MATPLTDKINALTSAANETTGASDTTLGDAVATLIAGFGGSALTKQTHLTVTEEATFGALLEANPIPLSYETEIMIVFNEGNNLPTQGTQNVGAIIFILINKSDSVNGRGNMVYSYENNITTTPSTLRTKSTWYSLTGYYWITSDSGAYIRYTSSNTVYNFYMPVGNSITYIEIPIDFVNAEIES